MSYEPRVDPATLAAHLDDPAWRVIDCRFDLGEAGAGALGFARGHIPGARYAHLDQDLSAPRTPWSGRHPLPDPEALAATFGRLGIDAGIQVVACDESGGAYAARLWWLLRWLGRPPLAAVDGGLGAWRPRRLPLGPAQKARRAAPVRAGA